MKKSLFLSCCLLVLAICPELVHAQAENPDFFRSIGKIYAVVGVLLVTLIGLFITLFLLERRIAKLENMNE